MKEKLKIPQKDAVKMLREDYIRRREEASKSAKEVAEKIKKSKKVGRVASSRNKRPADVEL